MTTDRKNFDFRLDRGIIVQNWISGCSLSVRHLVWDIVVWCSSGFSQIPETLAAQCFSALLIESKWWNALFLPQFWPQWNDFFCFFWYTIFWFPGVVQLIERAVWDREARGFEPHHSDQKPSEIFWFQRAFIFRPYCFTWWFRVTEWTHYSISWQYFYRRQFLELLNSCSFLLDAYSNTSSRLSFFG